MCDDQTDRDLKSLFEESPIAYHEVDSGGVIRRVNRAECELLGLKPDEILDRPVWELLPPDRREDNRDLFHQAMKGEFCGPMELDYFRPDGSRATAAVYFTPIRDSHGRTVGLRSARLDITARKRAERDHELQKRLAQFGADVTNALAVCPSLDDSLKRCADAMVRHLGAALARIWTLNPDDRVLELRANAGGCTPVPGTYDRIPLGKFKIGKIAEERRPYLTNSVVGDPRIDQEWARREGVVAFAGYPLMIDGDVVGALAMFSRHALTQATLEALGSVAQGIALGIERKKTEEELRKSEARYRRIIDTAAEGIWIGDAESRATLVNRRMAEILGYPPEEIVGHTPFDFVRPDQLEFVRQKLASLHNGNKETADFLQHRPDGSSTWVSICSTPILDDDGKVAGTIHMFTDITERKHAEDALRASEEFNKGIVESTGDGILVLDTTGRFLYLSPAALWLLEIEDESEWMDRSWLDSWSGPDREKMETALENAAAGWSSSFEGSYTAAQGAVRHLEVSFSAIRNGGDGAQRLVAILRDITERKQLQLQLTQAQKLESIGQLAAGIAHEINTPIQYVGDNARFVQDAFRDLQPMLELDKLPADRRSDADYLCGEIPKALEQLLEGTGRVAGIVRAMREFSHPGPAEKTSLDLNRAIQSTILVSRNEWKYVAEMIEDLDWELPAVVCVPGEINQVMLNLIVNAAHAIADTARKGSITISTRSDAGWVEMRVRDTGTGIPEAIRGKVFDHFFTTKDVGKGTGQGLALAHAAIVKNHGGTIRFETEESVGTTFIVRLPVEEVKSE